MATKLTLSLNEQTIKKAKVWAKEHHASLSGLVENYFESLVPIKTTTYRPPKPKRFQACLRHMMKETIDTKI